MPLQPLVEEHPFARPPFPSPANSESSCFYSVLSVFCSCRGLISLSLVIMRQGFVFLQYKLKGRGKLTNDCTVSTDSCCRGTVCPQAKICIPFSLLMLISNSPAKINFYATLCNDLSASFSSISSLKQRWIYKILNFARLYKTYHFVE